MTSGEGQAGEWYPEWMPQADRPLWFSRFLTAFENSRWQFGLVVFLSLTLTAILAFRTEGLRPGDPAWDEPTDHHKYLWMAAHPLGSFHIQPACWRIATPLLVSLMPVDHRTGFQILTFLSIASLGPLLFIWLGDLGYSAACRLTGVIMLYSYGALSKLSLRFPASPDPFAHVVLLVLLICIARRWNLAFALALTVGVAVKETLAPAGLLFYSLQATRWIDRPLLLRSILAGLPAFATLLGIRYLIPALNHDDAYVQTLAPIYSEVAFGKATYDLMDGLKGCFQVYRQMSPAEVFRILTFGAMGVYLFLPFLDPRRNKEIFLRWLPYTGLVAASLLIALNPDRRIASCAPMIVLMSLNGVQVLARATGISTGAFLLPFAIKFALLLLVRRQSVPAFDFEAAGLLVGMLIITRGAWLKPPREVPAR